LRILRDKKRNLKLKLINSWQLKLLTHLLIWILLNLIRQLEIWVQY